MPIPPETQRLNYHKKKQLGLCVWYGCERRVTTGCHCIEHRKKRKLYQRRAAKCKAWKKGKRGRPPIDSRKTVLTKGAM